MAPLGLLSAIIPAEKSVPARGDPRLEHVGERGSVWCVMVVLPVKKTMVGVLMHFTNALRGMEWPQ